MEPYKEKEQPLAALIIIIHLIVQFTHTLPFGANVKHY